MIKLKIYNNTYFSLCRFPDKNAYCYERKRERRLKADWEKNLTDNKEIERISLSRTKNNIKNICLSNNFEYFCTMTVNSKNADRFSLQEVQDKMKKICKSIKRKNKDFAYIYITEEHKNGAFHFHGMVKNIDLYINKNFYLSSADFDKLGYNSFSPIKDYNKCCNYITKYITKDCVKNENNQIYFCSRGLSKGFEEYMIDSDLKKIFVVPEGAKSPVFENEYCQKIDFSIDRLNIEHSKRLFALFNENDNIMHNDNNYITNLLNHLTKKEINII